MPSRENPLDVFLKAREGEGPRGGVGCGDEASKLRDGNRSDLLGELAHDELLGELALLLRLVWAFYDRALSC
jgi:hypothetical protein